MYQWNQKRTAKQSEDDKKAKPQGIREIVTSKNVRCYKVPFSSASQIPILL